MRSQRGDEEGSISLLSLGFAVLALVLILVGASATSLHLNRTRLLQVADELSVDAADAMDLPAYYAGDASRPTEDAAIDLSRSSARAAVEEHLSEYAGRYHLDGVSLVSVESPDGNTVVVTVSTVVHPLFGLEALLPWTDGVTLTATSSARAH